MEKKIELKKNCEKRRSLEEEQRKKKVSIARYEEKKIRNDRDWKKLLLR